MKITSPRTALKLSIFFTGFAGIVSEYLLSTLASYLLGDSIFQWSITISIMLLAMGIGARVSKEIKEKFLLDVLMGVEILLSLLVSFSVYITYLQAPFEDRLSLFIYAVCFLTGFLIGLEIPLAIRINEHFEELKENISSILEKDYLGALPGGILYGYFFLPRLGLVYTPVVVGMVNLAVASLLFVGFKERIKNWMRFSYFLALLAIIAFAYFARPLYLRAEQRFYRDPIVFLKQTPYQKIVLTRWRNNYLLYLDGHLQLSTVDEKRYHETLVHVPMAMVSEPSRALIVGGGDGCTLREILKYPCLRHIDMVDMDREFVEFAKTNPIMQQINHHSLESKKVCLYFEDGFRFVKKIWRQGRIHYDIIIIDLTDPRNEKSCRLYSREFYEMLYNILSPKGVLITQATSPFFCKKAFCCILNTLISAHFYAYPLKINIPSFGEWGFVMAIKYPLPLSRVRARVEKNFRGKYTLYLTPAMASSLFLMGKDFSCKGIKTNTLIHPYLITYYDDSMWELL